MIWKPNVTIASIVELDGKFLMVEEESVSGPVLNQPAGHLEPNESYQTILELRCSTLKLAEDK